MLSQAVRPIVLMQLVALIFTATLVIGAAACTRANEAGPPATTIPPTQPAATPAPDTPVAEGSISLATPDDAASGSLEPTVEGSLEREPQVTPPALLPATAEPTAPAVRTGTTPESEGPAPTETPTSPLQPQIPPTDTPVPPTNTPEPPAPPTGNRVGQSAPDFTVETIDGVTRSLTDYKQASQPVVLYFFASW